MANTTVAKPAAKTAEGNAVLSHMPAIDGLRGVAILLVMIHHLTPAVSGNAMTRRMLEVAHTGWIGVDLFFVLSGFLITAILLRTRKSEDYFLNFFARRTLRIFPLYYVTLGILILGLPVALKVPYLGDFLNTWFYKVTRDLPVMLDGQGWLWAYGANLKIALEGERWGAVNHFWSLAVEEHFYLVWPVVVYFCSREKLIRVCLGCILAAPILRGMLMAAGFDSVVPYVLTPCRVDSLAIGGLMAVLVTMPGGLKLWTPRVGFLAGLATVALVAMVIYYGRLHRDDFLTSFLGYSMLALVSCYLVLVTAGITAGSVACRIVANPVLSSFGKYSYGLYVTHMLFTGAFSKLFPWDGLRQLTGSYQMAIVINCVLSIGCSWVIAWLSFHLMEKHFLRLKSFFDYRRPATVPQPVRQPLPVRPIRILGPISQVQAVRQAA